MRILVLADLESKYLWDYYESGKLSDIDLVLSCGDLKAVYLDFIATFSPCPVLYVRGNHDESFDEKPPEGCICIDGKLVNYGGVRILGLGGSMRYRPGLYQYTDKEMARRAARLNFRIRRAGGFDILLTHAPARGINDGSDLAHRGFTVFNKLIETWHPSFFVHGHVHMNYGYQIPRLTQQGPTSIINAYERYVIEF